MSSREIAFAAAGVGGDVNYIEDVFSTYLYTGTGLSVNNTITNGIDLAAEGGLVWTKARSVGYNNALNDTARGFSNYLISNSTGAQNSAGSLVTMTANSNGYTVNDTNGSWNESGQNFVSWTFRKQPKFFDVVTYTGNGVAGRTVSHNLGSVPGMIIVKCTSAVGNWDVYHRGVNGGTNPQNYNMVLNTTAAQSLSSTRWNNTAPTSTEFTVGTSANVNDSGATYVAYLFAHNAGGFGTSGTDNVISCGSFTASSAVTDINLGYEPQWILIKRSDSSAGPVGWYIYDSMRGMPVDLGTSAGLQPNTANAEAVTGSFGPAPTATGFQYLDALTTPATFIYMAIRRPMKVPTDATTVFSPVYVPTVSPGTKSTTGFPIDLQILSYTTGTTENQTFVDRLRGISTTSTESGALLISSSTAAEATTPAETRFWDNTGFQQQSYFSGGSGVYWNFSRRPGFFDEVCYTGTGVAGQTYNHNLGVAPELMIVKQRDATNSWRVYNQFSGATKNMLLDAASPAGTVTSVWNNTAPTSSVFSVGTYAGVNGSGNTYVAYLFATCPGVSKVGSYTGTGATQTINCGFTGGARFVLIKRTDSTGDWYVWDTARGMVSGTDPSLLLNSTAAEVNANSVYTATTGFQIVSTAAGINASGGTYIYLAIA